jgi:hypothetical protein
MRFVIPLFLTAFTLFSHAACMVTTPPVPPSLPSQVSQGGIVGIENAICKCTCQPAVGNAMQVIAGFNRVSKYGDTSEAFSIGHAKPSTPYLNDKSFPLASSQAAVSPQAIKNTPNLVTPTSQLPPLVGSPDLQKRDSPVSHSPLIVTQTGIPAPIVATSSMQQLAPLMSPFLALPPAGQRTEAQLADLEASRKSHKKEKKAIKQAAKDKKQADLINAQHPPIDPKLAPAQLDAKETAKLEKKAKKQALLDAQQAGLNPSQAQAIIDAQKAAKKDKKANKDNKARQDIRAQEQAALLRAQQPHSDQNQIQANLVAQKAAKKAEKAKMHAQPAIIADPKLAQPQILQK